jgi:hypothetical protein
MTTSWRFERPAGALAGSRIKAGFHCHTVNSDGGLSPADTVGEYRAKVYQCLGISDHRTITPVARFSDGEFLGIEAIEAGGNPDIIGVGVREAPDPELPFDQKAPMLASQGAFTIAVHPTYCAALPHDYLGVDGLMALEIYNAYCDHAYTNGLATELWDMLLGQGQRLWGVASDDAHLNPKKRYYSAAGLGWVEMWADALTREGVLQALMEGRFFSTQGPQFREIVVEDAAIALACTPVCQVRWRTHGSTGFVDYAPEDGALEAWRLPEWFRPRRFVRVELVDRQGRRAWSNPIYVAEPSS